MPRLGDYLSDAPRLLGRSLRWFAPRIPGRHGSLVEPAREREPVGVWSKPKAASEEQAVATPSNPGSPQTPVAGGGVFKEPRKPSSPQTPVVKGVVSESPSNCGSPQTPIVEDYDCKSQQL